MRGGEEVGGEREQKREQDDEGRRRGCEISSSPLHACTCTGKEVYEEDVDEGAGGGEEFGKREEPFSLFFFLFLFLFSLYIYTSFFNDFNFYKFPKKSQKSRKW